MSPELSIRLAKIIPALQATITEQEYWSLQDRFLKANKFEDLDKADQELIIKVEE